MADNEIDIKIDNKQVLTALDQINKRLDSFGKSAEKSLKNLDKNTKSAFKGMADAASKLQGPLNSAANVLKGFGALAIGALGVKAFKAVAGSFDDVIDAAVKQENALNDLKFALARTGEFSNEAFKEMQKFASAIQDATGVGDELVLESLSIAKSFGATNEQAKKLTTAAIEMAAATGKSLPEAIKQVSKTLGGMAGELGELNPKIKALTSEQLKAGQAAQILIDTYGGSAANKLNTFSGAIEAAKGRFGDLQEVIGDLIIKNPLVIGLIGKVGDAFKTLGEFIKENSGGIGTVFTKGLAETIRSFSALVVSFDALGRSFSKLASIFLGERSVFTNIAGVIGYITDETLALTETILSLRQILNDPLGLSKTGFSFGILPDQGKEVDELDQKLSASIKAIKEQRLELAAAIASITGEASFAEGAKIVDSGLSKVALEIATLANNVESGSISQDKNTAEIKNQIQATNKISEAFKLPDNLFDFGPIGNILLAGANAIKAAGQSFATNFVGSAVQGAEGAKKLLVGAGSAAADALFPGAGQAVGPIIDALSQGPDFVREQVREFVKALPELLNNIAEAIPVLVEELAANADEIIIALVKATPALTRAIVIEVPKQLSNPALWVDVARSLGEALASEIVGGQVSFSAEKLNMILENIWATFSTSVSETLTELTSGFGRALSNALPSFAVEFGGELDQQAINFRNKIAEGLKLIGDQDRLNEAGRKFANGIKDRLSELTATPRNLGKRLFSGFFDAFINRAQELGQAIADGFNPGQIGGSEGLVPDSTPIIGGLAKGGTIPPGFNNDTFSAFLSSGELVVPTNDVERLRSFLADQESGSADNGVLVALLSQILSALQQPITVETTAQVNNKALADIILKLNRTNARLTA